MRRASLPILSGLLGGGVAIAVALILGLAGGGDTTTVVRQAPLAAESAAGQTESGEALTAGEVYDRYANGVVFIRAKVQQSTPSPFGFPQQQQGEATGSGFVIDEQGNILTNAHVVHGATEVTVTFDDEKTVEAEVVGTDVSTDLALLRVDPEGLDLEPLPLGSSEDVEVGDPVLAIGNPFGLDRTLTTGVVSALQREITAPNGLTIRNVIQTDAAINPGNSGGPLLDASGHVIGINSQIATAGGRGNIGIGFAVPIETAQRILPALKHGEPVERGYLGVTTVTVDDAFSGLDLGVQSGALVQSVVDGSPADEAGLRGGDITAQLQSGRSVQLGGDVITAVAGEKIATSDDLAAAITQKDPGDEVRVEYLRDGMQKSATLKLAERPADPSSG